MFLVKLRAIFNRGPFMGMKMRLVLPLAQVMIAAALTTSNYLGSDTPEYPAWTHPDRLLCDALNAPAALVRFGFRQLWWQFRSFDGLSGVPFLIDTLLFGASVWLLWYVVCIEMEGKGKSLSRSSTGRRAVFDIGAILFGLAVPLPLFQVSQHILSKIVAMIVNTMYLVWVIAIIGFYGHDLYMFMKRGTRGGTRDSTLKHNNF
ncbi:MAG: hypothetical protein ABL962_18360 [Fimbriimonadaceae bacterium]